MTLKWLNGILLKLCNYTSYFVLQVLLIFQLMFSLLDCSVQLDQGSLTPVMFIMYPLLYLFRF